MSYIGAFVLVCVFFCLGMMFGMLVAFGSIIEIVNGLVDFLIERRNYTVPKTDNYDDTDSD